MTFCMHDAYVLQSTTFQWESHNVAMGWSASMRFMKTVFVVLICVAAAAAAFSAGYAACLVLRPANASPGDDGRASVAAHAAEPDQQEQATFGVFWEAWHLLEDNYFGNLPALQKMSYAAIRGVLSELRDPHTIFVEPPQRQLEKDEHRGSFGGIGVWIYQRETDRAFMLTPIEDGPAARAGVREGDVLTRVDETTIDTLSMSRDDVVTLIRGPVGSIVSIGVSRKNSDDEIRIEITRAEYETPSVEWRMLEERAPNVVYLHILQFTERTTGEVREAIAEARRRGATRLVLDLRDNPGGLLDASLDVTSEFLSEGPIMYEQRRDGSEQVYQVKAGGTVLDLPMAALVNGGTASAAEIVAGALHDAGRALLIGEPTYGKGSVQLVYDLSDGSSVHVTVAKWLTAGRRPIDGVGIEPDQTVVITQEDRAQARDSQLNAAILSLTK